MKEWKTIRAVVEVRTNENLTEKQLANAVADANKELERSLERKLKAAHVRVRYKSFKRTVSALTRWEG